MAVEEGGGRQRGELDALLSKVLGKYYLGTGSSLKADIARAWTIIRANLDKFARTAEDSNVPGWAGGGKGETRDNPDVWYLLQSLVSADGRLSDADKKTFANAGSGGTGLPVDEYAAAVKNFEAKLAADGVQVTSLGVDPNVATATAQPIPAAQPESQVIDIPDESTFAPQQVIDIPDESTFAPAGVTNDPGTGTDVTSGLDDPGGARQVPGGGQVWRVDGVHLYMVYQVPGTNVPLVWRIEDPDRLQAIFPDGNPEISRELTQAEFQKFSPWQIGGLSQELVVTSTDPWVMLLSEWSKAKKLRPWLDDPSMLATVAVAYLEGRTPTLDELAQTDWWNNTTEAERNWLEFSVTAGSQEVARRLGDAEAAVAERLRQAGMHEPPPSIVKLIAERTVTGKWSETFSNQQIRKLTDPFSPGDLDPSLDSLVRRGATAEGAGAGTSALDRNKEGEERVRQLAVQWLGPEMGAMTENDVARWASRIRIEPDAMDELTEFLRQQRMAILPGYTNPNLTYADIVGPMQNLAANIWGRPVQDQALLVDLANMMDYSAASQRLRQAGLQRGIKKVTNDALAGLTSTSMGQQVIQSSI